MAHRRVPTRWRCVMASISARRLFIKRERMGRLERREAIAGVLFVAPWLLSLLIFTLYPVIAAFFLSFTDYNIVEPPKWIGLDNYRKMFTGDTAFWTTVRNSGYYALISVPLGLITSLILAMI